VKLSDVFCVQESRGLSPEGIETVTQVIRPDIPALLELLRPIMPFASEGMACLLVHRLLREGGWSVRWEREEQIAPVIPGRNELGKFISSVVVSKSIVFTRYREV
jgi:hypothetical protein